MKIAIIGAGLTGLVLAEKLSKKYDVTVFEKARGVGGRLATKYNEEFQFDIGAQFFIAKTPEFQSYLKPFLDKEVVLPWYCQFAEIDGCSVTRVAEWVDEPTHYVASPKMTSLCKAIAEPLDVRLQTKIQKILFANKQWQLITEDNTFEAFDWLLLAIPAEQALELLPSKFRYYDRIRQYKMQGCYSLNVGLTTEHKAPWHAALVKNNLLSWISFHETKPGRQKATAITTLSTNDFADEHIDHPAEQVQKKLLSALLEIIPHESHDIDFVHLHRWKYANISKQYGPKSFCDPSMHLGVAGDWTIQGLAEAAFLSASDLIYQIKL